MFIITTLLSLLTGAFGPIMQWAKRKQDLALAKQEAEQRIQLQMLKNEGIVEESEARNTQSRLAATSQTFKYITFVMWFYPFVVCQIAPTYATRVFTSLDILPGWYTNSCVIIMFAIWGISVTAPVVTGMFSNLGSYIQGRREHVERVASINRGAVFNELRKDARNGKLDDNFVKIVDKALDAAEADMTSQQ